MFARRFHLLRLQIAELQFARMAFEIVIERNEGLFLSGQEKNPQRLIEEIDRSQANANSSQLFRCRNEIGRVTSNRAAVDVQQLCVMKIS